MDEVACHVADPAVLAQAHVEAEVTNDLERILATVSDRPWFPLLDHAPAGGLALDLRATPEEVREYYAHRGTTYDIVASQGLHQFTTDWYFFRESVATLRHVGTVDRVPATGGEFQVNSAVVFPAAPDGIAGEIVWTRYPFGDVLSGTASPPAPVDAPAHLPGRQLAVASTHDAFISAWSDGDRDALLDCLAPEAHWAIRRWQANGEPHDHVRQGRDEVVAWLTDAGERETTRSVALVRRVVSEWYVMAEYAIATPQGPRRAVALHPVDDDGRLRAELAEQRDWRSGR